MKVNLIKYNKGFSLIELMVVVSIVSFMSALGIAAMRNFKGKALMIEGKSYGHVLHALMTSYTGESDGAVVDYTSGACANGFTNGFGHNSCALTSYDYRTSNCDYSNPFGFKIANCPGNRYHIVLGQLVANNAIWYGQVMMKPNVFRNNGYQADFYVLNKCGLTCQWQEFDAITGGSKAVQNCYTNFGTFISCD